MNKLTFALLLVGVFSAVALARSSPQIRRPFKFSPGQTYIYEYRGRQWNGIAKLADQYSGLTLDCDVVLQALPEQSGKEVVMKLDDIKVEQLHTQSLDQNDVRKLNQGQEQDQRQMTMYKEELSKPIRFTYQDGKVVRFVAESTDAEWSINIKKSILSLFQLDLAPTKMIVKGEQQQLTGYYGEQQVLRPTGIQQDMPMVYPVYEESFGGICETLYQIDSVNNVEQRKQQQDYVIEINDVLNVTKTVNYKNCLTDPSVSYDRHSFDVNTQTFKGRLFTQQPQQQNYQQTAAKDIVSPVERQSYTKYNISTVAPKQLLVNGRLVEAYSQQQQSQQQDMSMIEGIYSEGKIKYQADGDLLMSDTQQSLRLITCVPTSDLARLVPEMSGQLVDVQPQQPTVQYETIQCELSAQRIKFYQAVSKFAQVQQSLAKQQQSPSSALYSHQLVLPYALSASWYPLVATGQDSADQSVERLLDPEQLAKSYEHLLVSLAEDVISEDVAQSKKAGEKIIRLVNAVAFMPKYKLAEVYERIVEHIQQAKQQQVRANQKQTGSSASYQVDNDEVAKWKVVRKLYLDSLPLAGSKQAVEMIEQLIEQQRVRGWEAREMCEAVPANLRYPDTEVIDAFIRVSQLPHVRKNRSLFASCSISVGKMIAAAYSKSKDASYKPTTYEPVATGNNRVNQVRSGDLYSNQINQINAADDEIYKQVVDEADVRRQLPKEFGQSRDQQNLYDRLVLDEQDLIKYVKLYKQMLQKASGHHEKVVYIETLAHMRVPQVLPILEPFVSGRLSLGQCLGQQPLDTSRPLEQSQWYNYYGRQRYVKQQQQPQSQQQQFTAQSQKQQVDWSEEDAQSAEECNYMRALTIYALAHNVRSSPEQVQKMLLPVFDNTYEPYQIRIAAFTTMMLAPVEEHILERVASQMWREPNKEVASFVVGTIDTMSKMTAPMMAPFKQAALKASESMPKQYLDTWKFSWLAGGDHFNYQKDTGLAWVSELIKSNVSSVPRAGYFHFGRYHGQQGSKFDNHLELGFTAKGLESLIKDYIEYNKQQQQEQDGQQTGSLVASIIENLYDAKDDLATYYREARDSVKKSILLPEEQVKSGNLFNKNFHFKRQQPIDGVNSPLGKQQRSQESLFEVNSRPKRSVTIQARNSQAAQQEDADEEAKLTIFSKLFDSTSYHALDRKSIVQLLEKSDDYLKMVADQLILGSKLHYVKMMVPSNMWHMVPSQIGLPVIATHRSPIVASIKIDGSKNGQLTSNLLSQYFRNQQQQQNQHQQTSTSGQNFNTMSQLNITALVHPKVIHSNFRFLFAVEQACGEAYGVQVEKSHQLSVPMDVSVAYSQPKQLFSLTVEPKTPVRALWTKEAAKTFIGQVSLSSQQPDSNWLGREQLIRVASGQSQYQRQHHDEQLVPSILSTVQSLIQEPRKSQLQAIEELETPYKFEHRFVQELLGLELYLEGVSDDEQVVEAMEKPEKQSRGYSQWTSTEQVDELDQHTKCGPFSGLLHAIESGMNRQSKYLEFYSTLKPVQSSRKSPVYRFDFVLSGQQQQKKTTSGSQRFQSQQLVNSIGRRQSTSFGQRQPIDQLTSSSRVWDTIEQTKKFNQQQPIMMEVY